VEEKKNIYRILVGKTEGKKPLGRLWFRCEECIKKINENPNYSIRRIAPNKGERDGFIGILLCKC